MGRNFVIEDPEASHETSRQYSSVRDEAKGWISLLNDQGTSSRGISFQKHLLVVLACCSSKGHLYTPQQALLKDILMTACPTANDEFPYNHVFEPRSSRMVMRFSERAKDMPVKMFIIMNVAIHQFYHIQGGMYTSVTDTVNALKMHLRCWNDPRSYEDAMLEMKGFIDYVPLLISDNFVGENLEVSEIGEPIRYESNVPSVKVERDLTKYEELLSQFPEMSSFIRSASSLDELNILVAQALCAVSSPIYSSQPISLIALKSQHAKQDMLIQEPTPYLTVNGATILFKDDGFGSSKWSRGFHSLLAGSEASLSSVNLQNAFLRSVTAKSSGTIPIDFTENLKKAYPSKSASKLIKKKVGLLALGPEILQDPDIWAVASNLPPMVTVRYQVMRRPRIVVGVNLAMQMNTLHVQSVLKAIARTNEEIGVGKVKGDATDATFQLKETGNPNRIVSSADISGFDGRLGPSLRLYIRNVCGALFSENNGPYFWAHPDDYEGYVNGRNQIVHLSSVQVALARTTTRLTAPRSYDRSFNQNVVMSESTLSSGELGTTGYGTMTTAAIVRAMKIHLPELHISGHTAGDDLIMSFDKTEDPQLAMDKFSKAITEISNEIGMPLDPFFSSSHAIFLQMPALRGTTASAMYRLSLNTTEKPSVRTIFGGWQEIIGVGNEMIGRSNYPEGMLYLLDAMFLISGYTTTTRNKPKDPNHVWCPVTQRYYVRLPQINVHLQSFGGLPMPNVINNIGHTAQDSSCALRGDACMFNLLRRVKKAPFPDEVFHHIPTGHKDLEAIQVKSESKLKTSIKHSIDETAWSQMDYDRAFVYNDFREKNILTSSEVVGSEMETLIEKGTQTFRELRKEAFDRAASAKRYLDDYNVTVSPALDMTLAPRIKMLDIVLNEVRSKEAWNAYDLGLDKAYLRLSRRGKGPLSMPVSMIVFMVNYSKSDKEIITTSCAKIIPDVSIAPPSLASPYFRNSYIRDGTSNTRSVHDLAIVNSAVGSTYMEDRTDEITDILRQISKLDPALKSRALGHSADVMGLSPPETAALMRLSYNSDIVYESPINITNIPRASPWTNTDVRRVTTGTTQQYLTNSNKINAMRNVIATVIERSVGPYYGFNRIKIDYPLYHTGYMSKLFSFR